MRKWWMIALLPLALAVSPSSFSPSSAWAGDEDAKTPAAPSEPAEPEPMPAPVEPESPGLSLGQEEEPPSPEFKAEAPAPKAAPRRRKSPDLNLDYTELLSLVQPVEVQRGVLPPAQGSRGYRPNLIAASYGDRTPGYGLLLEYSWNRLGAGVFYSYHNVKDSDLYSYVETFGGLYALYRWLPWVFSPYILAGLEVGSKTAESFGGMLGLGLEVQVYYGWTALLGYTYHSTARKGYIGGAFGWSF